MILPSALLSEQKLRLKYRFKLEKLLRKAWYQCLNLEFRTLQK